MRFTYFRYEEHNHAENEVWTRFIHVPLTDEDDSLLLDFMHAINKLGDKYDFEAYFEEEEKNKFKIYSLDEVKVLIKENEKYPTKYPRYAIGEINENIDFRMSDEEGLSWEIGCLGFTKDPYKVI
jgi:hypothetical protein